jgi:hypothetical protein
MRKSVIIKIIRIFFALVVTGGVLWLFNMNFPMSRQIEVNAVLGRDKPMISRLGPDPRLKIEDDYQIILENPVYFDLRSLSWFTQSRIEIVYQEWGRKLVGMAGKVGAEWQYLEIKPLMISDYGDGWQQAVFSFDMTKLYHERNIRRFIISTEGETGSQLKIKSIKVILLR